MQRRRGLSDNCSCISNRLSISESLHHVNSYKILRAFASSRLCVEIFLIQFLAKLSYQLPFCPRVSDAKAVLFGVSLRLTAG
jgi:hypothetical protein